MRLRLWRNSTEIATSIKRERIISELSETILGNLEKVNENYDSMAKTLLEKGTPEQVIASLLKYSFKQDLDESQYKENKHHKRSEMVE